MKNKIFLLLAIAVTFSFAQHARSELTKEYLKSEEAMREDEYANSLKRRNWLKDRLIFQVGAGSKYASWGAEFFSVGGAVEYISKWNVGAFVSVGYIPPSADASFPADEDVSNAPPVPNKEGATNWRAGLTYTFFPKSALHPGISISYGKAYYDYLKNSSVLDTNTNTVQTLPNQKILFTDGVNVELTLSYLTNDWYYFSLNVGASYSGEPGSATNKSVEGGQSLVQGDTENGIAAWNPTVSAGFGFALPEFFPDKTEIRRRQRVKARKRFKL